MALETLKVGGKRKRTMKKRRVSRKSRKGTRRNRRRSNKGGFVGGIIEQALVPFGLFALQKKMQNRKMTKKSKSVKKRKN
tara:strand:- start:1563 stop:1802 length:240 start_codon:yes stop_codon:yes gene_type:complete